MSLTIHLGAHKTATTHLQMALRAAQWDLRRAGVYYSGPHYLRELRCPLTLALSDSGFTRKCQRAKRHLDAVLDFYPEVLLSDENMLGGARRTQLLNAKGVIYPEAGRRLRKMFRLLSNRPATIALSVRDPAGFMTSAFSLQVHRGEELEFEAFMGGRDPAAISWSDLATRILRLPNVGRLIVWRYEDYHPLRQRILRKLLPDALAEKVPDTQPSNVSISQEGYEWLIAQAMRDSDADLRDLATKARQDFARKDGFNALKVVSDDDMKRSAEGYQADVARLRAMPGVDFLDPDIPE